MYAELSPVIKVLIAHASISSYVLYSSLPNVVKDIVGNRLSKMADTQEPTSDFDRAIVEINPSPKRVGNHFKWRSTQTIRNSLKVPRFYLESCIVRHAYPDRNMDGIDVSDMVHHIRAALNTKSLIDFVGDNGVEPITDIIKTLYTRVYKCSVLIDSIISRHCRYTYDIDIKIRK